MTEAPGDAQQAGLRLVEAQWEDLLADAGLEAEQVAWWASTTMPKEGRDRGAMYFYPGPNPEPPHGLSPEQFAEATSDGFMEKHRIVVHMGYDTGDLSAAAREVYFLAVVRHELEHARQWSSELGRAALEIDAALVDPVLSEKVGGISGGALFYNCKPSELDANSASAMYVRSRCPADLVAEMEASACVNLIRSNTGPESVETLLQRTVAFLFQFRSLAEGRADGIPVRQYLDLYSTEAGVLWQTLTEEI